MAGMLGCGGGPEILFFPSRCFEAAGLEEGVGDHRHQRVSMQSRPGSTFEVVEPKLLLELLVSLFTDPPGLDRGSERLDGGIGRQVRHIVFLLPSRPPLADEPDLVTRHALLRLFSILCLWPSATRTRRAVKRHVSRPLVRRRQPTLCHLPSANNASAETGG